MSTRTLLDILRTATPDNPVSQETLRRELGYAGTRHVRRLIQSLRREGYLILSSTNQNHYGYFFPNDLESGQRYLLQFKGRAVSTLKTIKGMTRFIPANQLDFLDDIQGG